MIHATAQRISDEWRPALREVCVSRVLARSYEAAFINDQTGIALTI